MYGSRRSHRGGPASTRCRERSCIRRPSPNTDATGPTRARTCSTGTRVPSTGSRGSSNRGWTCLSCRPPASRRGRCSLRPCESGSRVCSVRFTAGTGRRRSGGSSLGPCRLREDGVQPAARMGGDPGRGGSGRRSGRGGPHRRHRSGQLGLPIHPLRHRRPRRGQWGLHRRLPGHRAADRPLVGHPDAGQRTGHVRSRVSAERCS